MSWNQGNYIIKGEEVKVKGKVRRKVVTESLSVAALVCNTDIVVEHSYDHK
jgi:hypothetical protein